MRTEFGGRRMEGGGWRMEEDYRNQRSDVSWRTFRSAEYLSWRSNRVRRNDLKFVMLVSCMWMQKLGDMFIK